MCGGALSKVGQVVSPLGSFLMGAFKGPKPPPVPAPRQAPRAPDEATISQRSAETLARRATMASMISTRPGGLGAAPVAGKLTLGS